MIPRLSPVSVVLFLLLSTIETLVQGFSGQLRPPQPPSCLSRRRNSNDNVVSLWQSSTSNIVFIVNDDDDDDDDRKRLEEEEDDDEDVVLETDPYEALAASEFDTVAPGQITTTTTSTELGTNIDWGGALGNLRQRVEDIEGGKSGDPSQALFRLMSSQSPNQLIGNFVQSATPQVIQAMSGAVSSLLGGLSSSQSGVEMIVQATGDKIGSLCFQLQMTGYMFRNAEYVIALKDLMQLRGSTTLQDYRDAFDRLDSNESGYIEASEVAELFRDVYDGGAPPLEIETFIKFFDQNKDGRISWDEFEQGLGAALSSSSTASSNRASYSLERLSLQGDDDDDVSASVGEPQVSGTVEIELENGTIVEVDANEYIESLKKEAEALKKAIAREKGLATSDSKSDLLGGAESPVAPQEDLGGIAEYIASRQGDVKSLTKGISPEIVDTMKMLVDFVLEGGETRKGKNIPKEQMEMEIPSLALQQLALWQLVLGYKLREAEATGDYLKLLE